MNGVSPIGWWNSFYIFLERNEAGSSKGKGKDASLVNGVSCWSDEKFILTQTPNLNWLPSPDLNLSYKTMT